MLGDPFAFLCSGTSISTTRDHSLEFSGSVEESYVKKRKQIHVHSGQNKKTKVAGTPVPKAIARFQDLEGLVPVWLLDNILKEFSSPTSIQMQAIPCILAGVPVIATAPTGSGKTLAFLAPLMTLLDKEGKGDQGPKTVRALVVAPTRELSNQIFRAFKRLCGDNDSLSGCILEQKEEVDESCWDFAVCTPNTLVFMLEREHLSLGATKFIVMDEADKLLDFGFAPQLDSILAKASRPHLVMFSATMAHDVMTLADSVMHSPVRISIGARNAAAAEIEQELLFVTTERGKLAALKQLSRDGKIVPPTLVFVQSKDRAEKLLRQFSGEGLVVDMISSDRSKDERAEVVERFRTGKVWVLIATDLLARGVDFKGVQLVINFDFPQTAEVYLHRIGRTGRAGCKGKAITLFQTQDVKYLRAIVNVMRQSGVEVPEWMLGLKKAKKPKKFK